MECSVMRYDVVFFFNDTATTEIYTLSLHDALPICGRQTAEGPGHLGVPRGQGPARAPVPVRGHGQGPQGGRGRRPVHEIGRAQRLNSSHANISYAVFCLKKKNLITSTFIISVRHPS